MKLALNLCLISILAVSVSAQDARQPNLFVQASVSFQSLQAKIPTNSITALRFFLKKEPSDECHFNQMDFKPITDYSMVDPIKKDIVKLFQIADGAHYSQLLNKYCLIDDKYMYESSSSEVDKKLYRKIYTPENFVIKSGESASIETICLQEPQLPVKPLYTRRCCGAGYQPEKYIPVSHNGWALIDDCIINVDTTKGIRRFNKKEDKIRIHPSNDMYAQIYIINDNELMNIIQRTGSKPSQRLIWAENLSLADIMEDKPGHTTFIAENLNVWFVPLHNYTIFIKSKGKCALYDFEAGKKELFTASLPLDHSPLALGRYFKQLKTDAQEFNKLYLTFLAFQWLTDPRKQVRDGKQIIDILKNTKIIPNKYELIWRTGNLFKSVHNEINQYID